MGRSSTSSSSSGVLSWISPRSATLAIAVLGIVVHLNIYSWLGALRSTLPDVPERGLGPAPPASAAFVPTPAHFTHSAAKLDELIDLAAADVDGATNKNVYLPEWIAEAKAYLKAQGLSFVPTQGNIGVSASTNSNAKPSTPNAKSNEPLSIGRYTDANPSPAYTLLDDGADDVERMQWDALRLVIGTLRWYILLSVLCCCAGVVGVLRSQLWLSRLFVIHSFLDFLLSTLSLLALAIVCTYPSVRAHLCDEFGSGEVRAWFSSPNPHAPGSVSGTSAQPNVDLAASGSTVSPGAASDATSTAASGWETLLDGVLASENCEESFRTTLVPLLMVVGLFFTALRLQCFFLVQRFYSGLLRCKVHQYGYHGTPESVESGASTPLERERRRKEDHHPYSPPPAPPASQHHNPSLYDTAHKSAYITALRHITTSFHSHFLPSSSANLANMGKKKQVRKFGEVKRMLNPKDDRLKANAAVASAAKKASSSGSSLTPDGTVVRHISTPASSMFFEHNTSLGPPYRVLVDTNFINFALQNKIELVQGMMDCLYAKSIPCITTCVISELEKLGPKYRIALRVARDPRFERLECSHKGTYADDCIVERIQSHKCYIVATCDRELRRRVRKVPGIPLMYIASRQFRIERLPDQGMAQ